ncbi:CAP domain-containing protein [Kitasatospora sp. NPDC018058]|uniref:CAP domain-containing protein n=1 Tax=Kitasatospora sp. NPDC018058 TaxID=3364025 RepID=UPI0037BF3634
MTARPIRRIVLAAAAATMAVMTAAQPVWADGQSPRTMSDQTTSDFQNECLTAINAYRAKHQASPLTIDQKAVDHAKTRALRSSQPGNFNHDGLAPGYGENLYWGSRGTPDPNTPYTPSTCKAAVESWYGQAGHYDFNNPGPDQAYETGSFTQLVWKATTAVGCARVGGAREGGPAGDGFYWHDTFIACDFTPPGNFYVQGEAASAYTKNVLPARS